MTLDEFLLARIAEDEDAAREAAALDPGYPVEGSALWAVRSDASGDAIVAISPPRVLAECEAKRRIIAEHPRDYSECGHCPGSYGNNEEYPCTTLRATALPYGDHPDYDEAWRP